MLGLKIWTVWRHKIRIKTNNWAKPDSELKEIVYFMCIPKHPACPQLDEFIPPMKQSVQVN